MPMAGGRRGGWFSPSPGVAKALQRALATLRRDTTAQCVILTDGEGRVIAEAGGNRGGVLDDVLSILVREIAVTTSLRQSWDESPVLSLHHYEGGQYEIYAAAAADFPFLLVILTWRKAPAYSGVTWLFVRRTMQELRWLLRPEERPQPEPGAEQEEEQEEPEEGGDGQVGRTGERQPGGLLRWFSRGGADGHARGERVEEVGGPRVQRLRRTLRQALWLSRRRRGEE